MSHDIESNYTNEYQNEEKQCKYCDSFSLDNEVCFCEESEEDVSPVGHCDFFRTK